jgi:hypothetical protein
MKNTLTELLKVKSLITLALVGSLVFLAISDRVSVPAEVYVSIVSSVITYYFTRKVNEK